VDSPIRPERRYALKSGRKCGVTASYRISEDDTVEIMAILGQQDLDDWIL
jgi:hypothetical protein